MREFMAERASCSIVRGFRVRHGWNGSVGVRLGQTAVWNGAG